MIRVRLHILRNRLQNVLKSYGLDGGGGGANFNRVYGALVSSAAAVRLLFRTITCGLRITIIITVILGRLWKNFLKKLKIIKNVITDFVEKTFLITNRSSKQPCYILPRFRSRTTLYTATIIIVRLSVAEEIFNSDNKQ